MNRALLSELEDLRDAVNSMASPGGPRRLDFLRQLEEDGAKPHELLAYAQALLVTKKRELAGIENKISKFARLAAQNEAAAAEFELEQQRKRGAP